MAEKKTVKQALNRATKTTKRTSTSAKAFTAEERAAMKARAQELKAGASREAGERALREKIDELEGTDRAMAERLHALITATAPDLAPRTYYGMPAWAKEGKVLCWFTPAAKFKERYATLGFGETAKLDDGAMWPTSWALTELTPAAEKQIAALVKKAAS